MKSTVATLVLGIALLCSLTAQAEDPSFEAFGQAPIAQGDRARAHERALDDAFRQAVSQAATLVMGSDAAQSSDVRLRILPRAKSYVVNYRILDESDQPNGALQVHISAQVGNARLVADLSHGGAVAAAPMRAVFVCAADSSVATLLGQALGGRQLNVRTLPGCAGGLEHTLRSVNSDMDGALGAEVALTPGGAVRGTDQVAAHADVTVRLYESGGRVSGEGRAQADAYGKDAAAAEASARSTAAEHAVAALRHALDAKWPIGGHAGVLVSVGTTRYADYSAISRALGQVPGVSAVEPRRFADGAVELWATTDLPPARVAEALGRVPGSSSWTAQAEGSRVRVHVVDGASLPGGPSSGGSGPSGQ